MVVAANEFLVAFRFQIVVFRSVRFSIFLALGAITMISIGGWMHAES